MCDFDVVTPSSSVDCNHFSHAKRRANSSLLTVCLILNRTMLKESIKHWVKNELIFFSGCIWKIAYRSKWIVVWISTALFFFFCWHKWRIKHPLSYSFHLVCEISYPHSSLFFSINNFSNVSNLTAVHFEKTKHLLVA